MKFSYNHLRADIAIFFLAKCGAIKDSEIMPQAQIHQIYSVGGNEGERSGQRWLAVLVSFS
jgi:hypothetical protein